MYSDSSFYSSLPTSKIFFNSNLSDLNTVSVNQASKSKDLVETIFYKSQFFWSSLFGNRKDSMDEKPVEQQSQIYEQQVDPLLTTDSHYVHYNNDLEFESQPCYKQIQDTKTNYFLIESEDQKLQDSEDFIEDQPMIEQLSYQEPEIENKIKMRQINSKLRRKIFTSDEDQIIINCIMEYGCNFSKISKHLPHRNEQMIRNRYKSKIRKLIENNQLLTQKKVKHFRKNQMWQKSPLFNYSFNFKSNESPKNDQERLQSIKQLQSQIEIIENLVKNARSEIMSEINKYQVSQANQEH